MSNLVKKKCCRACLKEIRTVVGLTSLLDPPMPIIQMRDGVNATSYLQCYLYVCLRNNSKHFNSESLTDYSYICYKCKGQLMKALAFIVTSQRNEDFLISMYNKSTNNTRISDFGDELLSITNASDDEIEPNEGTSSDKETGVGEIEETSTTEAEEHTFRREITENKIESINETVEFEEVLIDTEKVVSEVKSISSDILIENLSTKKNENYKNRVKEIPKSPYKNKLNTFQCVLCRKVFELERYLYEHYDNEHDQRSLSFPCEICKNRHISKKSLIIHKRRIHKNIDYEDCPLCGKFISSVFSKAHKERHGKETIFECEECDRTFASRFYLNTHHKSVHGESKIRRFECPDCDRHFFTLRNLKLHALVHDKRCTEEKTEFLCDICSKTFETNSKLKVHLQMHRGDTMKCPHCEKQFVHLKDMNIHIRFHTKEFPFKCDICSRKFGIKTHLDHHRKQHEGVRYKCAICDKEFGHSFSLRQHSYQHRGYPLTCKVCSKGFPSLFKIRRHVKSAHSNLFGDGEYSESLAKQYYQRNQLEKMYPRVECFEGNEC